MLKLTNLLRIQNQIYKINHLSRARKIPEGTQSILTRRDRRRLY